MTSPARTAADLREDFEERAAIIEYCAGLSRADAEVAARAIVYGAGTAAVARGDCAEADRIAARAGVP